LAASDELRYKEYKRAEIGISLPKDTSNVRTHITSDRKYLSFDLAVLKAPLFTLSQENAAIWSGNIEVYPKDTFQKASRPWLVESSNSWNIDEGILSAEERYGVVQRVEVGQRRFGYNYTAYFLCKKSNDGRVFTATITYAEYTHNEDVKKSNVDKIKKILRSIKFL
jgi:hypothetical protein